MRLDKLLNIKYPIIQGGMANISDGEFAARVSNEGGLGVIGSGGMTGEELKREIEICKSLTDKTFGVNLMLMNPYIDEMAEIVMESGVAVVTTGAGNPGKYIRAWKDQGIKVFPVVSNTSLALRLERYDIDGIIAEGSEAGGHISSMTTMTLLKEMADRLEVPIIAAGGIGSGSQMIAAKILGAIGVQIGTLFLSSLECPIHKNYKDKLLASTSNNVTVIGEISGLPVRLIKNRMTREYLKKERAGMDKMELERYTLGSLKKSVIDGDIDQGSLMAGLTVSNIDRIRTIREILQDLSQEYEEGLVALVDEYKDRK